MIVSTFFNKKAVTFNLDKPLPIGIAVSRNNGVSSFSINHATYEDYQDGSFIGNISKGGSCNLETITFTPHGNGTHTECFGHIAKDEKAYVNDCIEDSFYFALLYSCTIKENEGNTYLNLDKVLNSDLQKYKALVLRSLPNSTEKTTTDYSGKNAAAIHPDDMQKIVDAGIEHIIVDLPSVDPEWDGGALQSHHIFWNYPKSTRRNCSITEFVYVDNIVVDGDYMLKLNIAPFISDAAPSKPILYALNQMS